MPGTNLTRVEAAERAALIAVEHYHIDLDLTGTGDTFGSTSTIRFTCRTPGTPTFVDLIAPQVERISLNGRDLPLSAFADSRIALPGLVAHNELVVQARCAYTNTGEGLHRFTDPLDGRTYLYSQFEVADSRRVFAVFEQPDIKATFAFAVTAPAEWTIVSNTPEVSVAPAGKGLVHRFAPTPRMSSYLTAIVAGPYTHWSSELTSADGRTIPLGLYARQSLAEHVDAEEIFDITARGFAFFEGAFDYPYPYAKYDQAFVPEFNAGAMENIGAVTITESYVFRSAATADRVERRAITVLHELAHMWFGDLVTMRWWNDLWLNESFAEYASHLAAAEGTRWTDAWTAFASVEKTWAYRQDQLPSTHPVVADIRDLQDVEVNFDGITYAKGASVLRQLVAFVGAGAFLRGVAAYFKRFAFDNAELSDLLAELEKASGRDLRTWAREWLQTAGVNTIGLDIVTDDDAQVAAASLTQSAPSDHPYLRPQRLAVAGYGEAGDGVRRLWGTELDIAGEITPVAIAAGRTHPGLILPNDGDLGYAKIRLDERSLAYAIAHLGDVMDPLARAVVWGSLWDQTRDAELAARDWVDVALTWLGSETSSSTLRTVLSGLATALSSYVAPEDREALTAAAAEKLGVVLAAAEAGSDAQLHLLRAFVGHARTPAQLGRVAAIRRGDIVVPGRPVDTDLMWELLGAEVRAGLAGEADIVAALESDPSAAGQAWAMRLRSTIPTAEAKAAAWAKATADHGLANELQGAAIAGFTDVTDTSLLVPYVEPYFALLAETWATRSHEMATNVVQGLYPSRLAGDPDLNVVAQTDAWLAELGDATPALRRLVIEARAGVVRAEAAQAFDRATR
ncbi:MAG: aminopeptidase N [Bifidobacteriaceae bacterium]|jgi:aminopeptidase N|nr:aminopeptidase N [Bifidobacteriaceae bacterium]